MIAYDLKCSQGHVFEGWFDDEATFLSQQQQGLIACPICNDAAVARIPSTFAIRSAGGDAGPEAEAVVRRVVAFIRNHFEDVGSDFAKEALKIHYGVSASRNIRGSSTPQEEETLRQEGVAFLKIPVPAAPESDA
ncbi:MAG: DUF1178 family protein [Desulfobacteraceae bacterium]|jgi:hypothetical protein|nr:DUF1178 family protein [Desulfobacteraceae bacterium]